MNILIFTLYQFETHSRVVIRALPEARLIIFLIHRTIFEDSPMPLTVLLIHQMLCHIVPATNGHVEILIRTEILIEIDMTDDILALYPALRSSTHDRDWYKAQWLLILSVIILAPAQPRKRAMSEPEMAVPNF